MPTAQTSKILADETITYLFILFWIGKVLTQKGREFYAPQ